MGGGLAGGCVNIKADSRSRNCHSFAGAECCELFRIQTAVEGGIQYAAAYRLNHCCLWNTGSSAFADDDD